jgi:hypothetical protein
MAVQIAATHTPMDASPITIKEVNLSRRRRRMSTIIVILGPSS